MTDYLRPASLDEAVAARAAHPDWVVLCGGTDLLVDANHRPAPPGVIDLWALGDLCGIVREPDGLRIGAATPWLDVVESAAVAEVAPILAAAAREIGALQIQARGTIGGNLGTSSPVGDSLPALLALDARIVLRSSGGVRTVPYADYCTGYRTTVLAADELIECVRIPAPHAGAKQMWRKVGTRRAQSISKVMAAAVLRVENGVFAEARIGLGAVANRPIRAAGAEAALLGAAPGPEAASAASAALAAELRPISDVRSTADYRLVTAQRLVARFVLACAVAFAFGACTGSGCNGGGNPSSETCNGPTRGTVSQIEIGRDLGDGFQPFADGDVVPMQTGGQGFPMIVVNLRVTGSDLGSCLPQMTDVLKDNELASSEGSPLVIHQIGATQWVSGDALLVSFDVTGGDQVRIESRAGTAVGSVTVWVDYVGIDAGTL